MSTIPSWCRVGAKVVCIDASRGDWNMAGGLVEGEVYTIAHAWVNSKGVAGCAVTAFPHGSLRINRFRPLVTIEDDISNHFQALLDVRAPQLEDAT